MMTSIIYDPPRGWWCLLCEGMLEGQEKVVGFCLHCEISLTRELLAEAEGKLGAEGQHID